MLELSHVSKTYAGPRDTVRALDDVSLRVTPGEFVVVRGPSGCGKSTLLLTAGALQAPDTGRVRIAEREPYNLSAEQRARLRAKTIGFVFQQFHLIPYLTVLENVMAPSLADGGNDARSRAGALVERLGLSRRAHHRPGELSVGERQRTALARALLNQPKLLLADEPTGNLDPDNATIVLEHIAEFAHAGGAVLMVTHDHVADDGADRIIHLAGGRLEPKT